MKTRIFTFLMFSFFLGNINVQAQLNTGTGSTWGELSPGEPLLLNEKFQGFEFFHSDNTPDAGNSDNKLGTDGETVIYGYKNDTVEVPILNSTNGKIMYYFNQCAFAPDWKTAYAFKDSTVNTDNVSNGFVEVSRTYAASGGNLPTVHGDFIVDLREIEFVEIIQWTHSSTGGNKRGVMCEFSVDNGTTWDTLRYQPGNAWGDSFTKDVFTKVKTANGFRCDPSAYGMTWEDGVWAENIMLRFAEAGGQTPRIHDLKVYGTYTPTTSAQNIITNDFKIYSSNKKIYISEPAKVNVYSITGTLVRSVENANRISMENYPDGIYIVKAQSGQRFSTSKVLIK